MAISRPTNCFSGRLWNWPRAATVSPRPIRWWARSWSMSAAASSAAAAHLYAELKHAEVLAIEAGGPAGARQHPLPQSGALLAHRAHRSLRRRGHRRRSRARRLLHGRSQSAGRRKRFRETARRRNRSRGRNPRSRGPPPERELCPIHPHRPALCNPQSRHVARRKDRRPA